MYINSSFKFLFYCVIIFISCIFYLLGIYYYELPDNNENITIILINSILLGTIASLIRIPANKFLGQDLNVVYMEMLYLFLLFLALLLYTEFFDKKKVHLHTYIIGGCIISLIALNDYLSIN